LQETLWEDCADRCVKILAFQAGKDSPAWQRGYLWGPVLGEEKIQLQELY